MTSFTIEKKGQTISFDSVFVELDDAMQYVSENLTSNSFAMNLLSQSKLSQKQISWIHYLATQDADTTPVVGEYQSLVKQMYDASSSKARKLHIHLPDVSISTVISGSNIGSLYIYENKCYVGKITQDGVLVGNVSEDVKNILLDANDNLLKLAQLYGHETGVCAVCHRELSDPISISRGIGPQCAKRFMN